MKRHFYVTDDLDDLDRIEEELESSGVHRPQIHVFSRDDAAVETHDHLHNIESVFKKDVVHGTIVGTFLGAALLTVMRNGLVQIEYRPADARPGGEFSRRNVFRQRQFADR